MDSHLLVLSPTDEAIYHVKPETGHVTTWTTGLGDFPDDIVVDSRYGYVYWTNMGRPDAKPETRAAPTFFVRNGSIERANFDGTGRTTIVARGSFTTGKRLSADFVAGRLYWCDREGKAVLSAEVDGTDCKVLYRPPEHDRNDAHGGYCVGVAVDPMRKRLYWTQRDTPNDGHGQILSAPMALPSGQDPENRTDVTTLWPGLPNPVDVQLDHDGNLLWTNCGNALTGNYVNKGHPDRPGQRPEIISDGYHDPTGLAVDGTIYVSDHSGVIRMINPTSGIDRQIADLNRPLAGMTIVHI